MTNNNFFQRILNWFFPRRQGSEPEKPSAQPRRMVPLVARMLQNTEEVELSCDEVFALLDQYTEMARRGEDVAHLMPLVKRHLDMCPDCREEYEALERILEKGL